MKSLKWQSLMMAVLLALLPTTALAYTFTGSYGYYNSYPSSYGAINYIEVFITEGPVTFEIPGLINYSGVFTGWTGQMVTPTYATATSLTLDSSVGFDMAFGYIGNPAPAQFTLDINYFNGSVLTLHEHYTVTGYQTWDSGSYVADNHQYHVPIPGSLVLLGSGLIGLACVALRRKKIS